MDVKTLGRAHGFTLMEVIGVMAVIAIMAAVATPQIFQAIEDARVTTLVQDSNSLKANVARFYKDTGIWPIHIPSHADDRYHQLMRNLGSNNLPISGWNGPYLEGELNNPIVSGGYVELRVSNHVAYACDIDGDGTGDGSFLVYRVDGITDSVGAKVSEMIDHDGATDDWKTDGKVKRYNGNHASILVMCLARV